MQSRSGKKRKSKGSVPNAYFRTACLGNTALLSANQAAHFVGWKKSAPELFRSNNCVSRFTFPDFDVETRFVGSHKYVGAG